MPEVFGPAFGGALLFSAVLGSCFAWVLLFQRHSQGLPLLERREETRTERPLGAVAVAAIWAGISLTDRVLADIAGRQAEPTTRLLAFALLLSLGVLTVVALLLFGNGRFRWQDVGFDRGRLQESLELGIGALFVVVLPTALILLATLPLRNVATQHTLLRLLGETLDVRVVAMLAFTAVVVAPLSEELLFRVTLQGWLTSRMDPSKGVTIVSVLFAAIHGWRDGLALLPLAFVLGYIYERRNDFVAVVVTHGLFNAANLGLMLVARQAQNS